MSADIVEKSLEKDRWMIRTHDLTKQYGETSAVNRVNLSIRQGEVCGFLGPNGAGKTTTMKMLLGLVKVTFGSADVTNKPLVI